MPTFRLYDLTIHCKDTQFTIREVDPNRYSWFELIVDLREAEIVHALSNVGVNVKVSYQSPNGRIEVQTNHDLLVMFQLIGSPLVNMYVEIGGEAEIGPSQLLSKPAHDWCMNIPLHLWARHRFSPAAKSDHVTNNLTESFNQWVGELRAKPILTLVDGLRSKMMARIHKQYERASRWKGPLTKEARKRLNKIVEVSRRCSVLYTSGDEYEVMDGQTRHFVYLQRKPCSCGFWEVSGILLGYVISGIHNYRMNE